MYHDYLSHIKYVFHRFGKSDTIYGAILLYNRMHLDQSEYHELMLRFNEMNNYQLPKVGDECKIPILVKNNEE